MAPRYRRAARRPYASPAHAAARSASSGVRAAGRRRRGSDATGTTPPAPDRTGFYAAVDPGPGPRGEVLGDRAARRSATGAHRLAGPLPHARRRRPARSPRRWPSPSPTASPRDPRPVVVWVHGAGGVAAGLRPVADRARGLVRGRAACAPARSSSRPTSPGLGMEGTVHPYLHGTTAGRSVLDAARAAAELTAAGAGHVVALAGHSAGGHRRAVGERAGGRRRRRRPRRPARRRRCPRSPTSPWRWPTSRRARASAAFAVQARRAPGPASSPSMPPTSSRPTALRRLHHLRADRLGGLGHVFRGDRGTRGSRADGFATTALGGRPRAAVGRAARRRGAGPARPRRRRRRRARRAGRSSSPPSCTGAELLDVPRRRPHGRPRRRPPTTSSTGSSPRWR